MGNVTGGFLMMLKYLGYDSTSTVAHRAHNLSSECRGEMIASMLFYVCGSHGARTPWPTKD